MARIRTIKQEFYTDEDLAECSIWARFIFPGLWQHADRDGRMEDRPKYLKTQILPYDSEDFDGLLQELHDNGHIVRYEVDGKRYIWVPNLGKHQRFTGKEAESKSTFPPCPQAQKGNEGETVDDSPVIPQRVTNVQERKGKERKGKERGDAREIVAKPVGLIPDPEDVKAHFAKSRATEAQAMAFWNHYDGFGWVIRGSPVENWRSLANKWIEADKANPPGKPNGTGGIVGETYQRLAG